MSKKERKVEGDLCVGDKVRMKHIGEDAIILGFDLHNYCLVTKKNGNLLENNLNSYAGFFYNEYGEIICIDKSLKVWAVKIFNLEKIDSNTTNSDKPKIEIGKFYSFNWDFTSQKRTVICKVKNLSNESINVSWRKYIWNNTESTYDSYYLSNISCVKELSLLEVQDYLPDNHPDKLKSSLETSSLIPVKLTPIENKAQTPLDFPKDKIYYRYRVIKEWDPSMVKGWKDSVYLPVGYESWTHIDEKESILILENNRWKTNFPMSHFEFIEEVDPTKKQNSTSFVLDEAVIFDDQKAYIRGFNKDLTEVRLELTETGGHDGYHELFDYDSKGNPINFHSNYHSGTEYWFAMIEDIKSCFENSIKDVKYYDLALIRPDKSSDIMQSIDTMGVITAIESVIRSTNILGKAEKTVKTNSDKLDLGLNKNKKKKEIILKEETITKLSC